MPRLSEDMTFGVIVKWLKKEGESVQRGEPLMEIETEKTTTTVDSPATGILKEVTEPEGAEVPVGKTMAFISGTDEGVTKVETTRQEVSEGLKFAVPSNATVTPIAGKEEVRLSPGARRVVKRHGLDITNIRGTGPGGRIVTEDVLKVITETHSPPLTAKVMRTIPMTTRRKTIADRLAHSWQTSVHATTVMEVDMSTIVELRQKVVSQTTLPISYTHLIVMAVAKALRQVPVMNSRLSGEEIELLEDVNIGIAVATEAGLVVPVVREVDRKSLADIASAVDELVKKATTGTLSIDEVGGGTFTISNFGTLGCDFATSIINPPQSGLLGVGRIVEKPVVVDGKITIRPMMYMCINFDHRILDGAEASRFLVTLREIFSNPSQLR